jgi:hypothetical protein
MSGGIVAPRPDDDTPPERRLSAEQRRADPDQRRPLLDRDADSESS